MKFKLEISTDKNDKTTSHNSKSILGIIGGVIGLLTSLLFLWGSLAFQASTGIESFLVYRYLLFILLSILGIIGALFLLKRNTKIAGILMLVCGLVGLVGLFSFTSDNIFLLTMTIPFTIAFVLLLIAGIRAIRIK